MKSCSTCCLPPASGAGGWRPPLLVGLASLGSIWQLVITNPIVLEFAFGMLIANLPRQFLTRWSSVLLLVAGGGIVYASGMEQISMTVRWWLLGIPAAALVAGLECSSVDAALTDGGSATLSGFVSSEDDRNQLAADLQQLTGSAVDLADVAVRPWPVCEALNIVAGIDAAGAPEPSVTANSDDGTYQSGEVVILTVALPDGGDGLERR